LKLKLVTSQPYSAAVAHQYHAYPLIPRKSPPSTPQNLGDSVRQQFHHHEESLWGKSWVWEAGEGERKSRGHRIKCWRGEQLWHLHLGKHQVKRVPASSEHLKHLPQDRRPCLTFNTEEKEREQRERSNPKQREGKLSKGHLFFAPSKPCLSKTWWWWNR